MPDSAGVNTSPYGDSEMVTVPADAPMPVSDSTFIFTCSSAAPAEIAAQHRQAATKNCFFMLFLPSQLKRK
ncbi:hypothetical protein GCM10027321_36710 [Massilia terrae]